MSDSNNKKKVVFSDTDTRHAQLKVRLQYDGISQAEFFRSFITGYLEKDKSIMEYIQRYKEHNKKMIEKTKNEEYIKALTKQLEIKNELLKKVIELKNKKKK